MMRESIPSPSHSHSSSLKKSLSDPSLSSSSSSSSNIFRNLKQFDIYQKIDENFRIQTNAGAIMSLVGWVVIAILVLAEVRNYATPRYNELLVVDTTFGEQMQVNINITFHALTCNEAHLDVMDVAGDNQLNVEHFMAKQRLTPHGKPIGLAGMEIIGERTVTPIPRGPSFCGSCYGAETPNRPCCNTCDELIKAYQEKDWNVMNILRNSTQCVNERAEHFANVEPGEGCTISGTMKVNKVSGNFHIAHGESIVRDSRHMHHFNPMTAPKFNVSHTINSLSFGKAFPNMAKNPLDSASKIIGENNSTGLFQYFIKLIPTVYKDDSGNVIRTNQYTVSDRFRPFVMPKFDGSEKFMEAVLPGIFFVFDISPFMIEADSHSMPFLHFLTKVCAIVGGVFTVLGVIDSIIYKLGRLSNKSK